MYQSLALVAIFNRGVQRHFQHCIRGYAPDEWPLSLCRKTILLGGRLALCSFDAWKRPRGARSQEAIERTRAPGVHPRARKS